MSVTTEAPYSSSYNPQTATLEIANGCDKAIEISCAVDVEGCETVVVPVGETLVAPFALEQEGRNARYELGTDEDGEVGEFELFLVYESGDCPPNCAAAPTRPPLGGILVAVAALTLGRSSRRASR